MSNRKDTEENTMEYKAKRKKIFGMIISFSIACFMFVAGKVYMKSQNSR